MSFRPIKREDDSKNDNMRNNNDNDPRYNDAYDAYGSFSLAPPGRGNDRGGNDTSYQNQRPNQRNDFGGHPPTHNDRPYNPSAQQTPSSYDNPSSFDSRRNAYEQPYGTDYRNQPSSSDPYSFSNRQPPPPRGPHDRPYDTSRGPPQDRPYDTSRGPQDRPYDSRGQDRPYDSRGQDRPYDSSRGPQDRHDSSRGPHDRHDSSRGPHDRHDSSRGQDRPYDPSRGQDRPYDSSRGPHDRQDSSRGPHDRPYGDLRGQDDSRGPQDGGRGHYQDRHQNAPHRSGPHDGNRSTPYDGNRGSTYDGNRGGPYDGNRGGPNRGRGDQPFYQRRGESNPPPRRHREMDVQSNDEVYANRFLLQAENKDLYRYEVFFSLPKDSNAIISFHNENRRRLIERYMENNHPSLQYAFDNISILITTSPLAPVPFPPTTSLASLTESHSLPPINGNSYLGKAPSPRTCLLSLHFQRVLNFHFIKEAVGSRAPMTHDLYHLHVQAMDIIFKEIFCYSKKNADKIVVDNNGNYYLEAQGHWLGELGRERIISLVSGCCLIPHLSPDYGWSITCNLSGRPSVPPGPLIDFIHKIMNVKGARQIDPIMADMNALLRRLRVEKIHFSSDASRPTRKFEVAGFISKSFVEKKDAGGNTAASYYFEHDGRRISVEQYFEEKHGKKLKYPHYPLIDLRHEAPVPAELLRICDVSLPRINENDLGLKSDIVKLMTMRSTERAVRILDYLNRLTKGREGELMSFGVDMKKEMTRVRHREMLGLNLQYACSGGRDRRERSHSLPPNLSLCQIVNGKFNLREKGFIFGGTMNSFLLVDARRYSDAGTFNKFIQGLFDQMAYLNMDFDPNALQLALQYSYPMKKGGDRRGGDRRGGDRRGDGGGDVIQNIERWLEDEILDRRTEVFGRHCRDEYDKDRNIQLAIILLDSNDQYLYSKLTSLFLSRGITTQCVTAAKAPYANTHGRQNSNPAEFYANLLSKINLKIGGVNRILGNTSIFRQLQKNIDSKDKTKETGGSEERREERKGELSAKRPILVIGADVTHLRISTTNKYTQKQHIYPSIAAMTMSSSAFTDGYYQCEVRAVKSKQETLHKEISEMVLDLYKKMEKRYPITPSLPGALLYFRDGVGEEMFESVLTELWEIQNTLQRHMGIAHLPVTCIVACKRGQVRFFALKNREYIDVLPGTLIPSFQRCYYPSSSPDTRKESATAPTAPGGRGERWESETLIDRDERETLLEEGEEREDHQKMEERRNRRIDDERVEREKKMKREKLLDKWEKEMESERKSKHTSSYIQSHKAIKGTAHPCRYDILYDENNLINTPLSSSGPASSIAISLWESICYELTSLNGRSLTINSYVTPTRYADLAAEKARKFLCDFDQQIQISMTDFNENDPQELDELRLIFAQQANLKLQALNKLPFMYWM